MNERYSRCTAHSRASRKVAGQLKSPWLSGNVTTLEEKAHRQIDTPRCGGCRADAKAVSSFVLEECPKHNNRAHYRSNPDVPGTLWIAHRIPEILDYVPEIHEPSNWSEPRLQGPTNKEADTIGLIARLPDKDAGQM